MIGDGSVERLQLVSPWRRQQCWAHLWRDIEAMIARGGPSQTLGEALQAQARQMLHGWHRVRHGTLAPANFARNIWPIRREVERLLEVGQTCGIPKTDGVYRELLKRPQALWTFVRHEEAEPSGWWACRPRQSLVCS